MARKKKIVDEGPRPCDSWEIQTEIQINGRNVTRGTELKIAGERGRFRFIKYVKTEKGVEWVDVIGGPKGAECWRSFRPEQVKTVHYKNKTDAAMAAQHKEKLKALREEREANAVSSEEDEQ
jgi:hypothetical protein